MKIGKSARIYLMSTLLVVVTMAAIAIVAICEDARAQGTAVTTLNFFNTCPDLAPGDVYHTGMSATEYEALTERWACLNETQASQRQETFEKVWAACYNVKLRKAVTICSIDPKRIGTYTGDFDNDDVSYTYGAWKSRATRKLGCDIDYADMPGCPNARRKLQSLLKRLGYGR